MDNNARLIRGAHAACEHSERDDSSKGGPKGYRKWESGRVPRVLFRAHNLDCPKKRYLIIGKWRLKYRSTPYLKSICALRIICSVPLMQSVFPTIECRGMI